MTAAALLAPAGTSRAQMSDFFTPKKTDKQVSQDIFDFFVDSCFAHSSGLEEWADKALGPGISLVATLQKNAANIFGYPLEAKTLKKWETTIDNRNNILMQVEDNGCAFVSDHISKPEDIKEQLLRFSYNVEQGTGFTTYFEEDQEDLEEWETTPLWYHYLLSIDNPDSASDGYIFVLLHHTTKSGVPNTRYFYFETDKFIKIRDLR